MISYAHALKNLPEEFRLPILAVVQAVESNLHDELAVRREDIDGLRADMRQLAVAQARTEARVGELAEAQARTEARVGELAEAQTRTEARVGGLAEAQTRTEARVGGLAEAQTRTEARVGELAEAQTRTEARVGGLEAALERLAQAQAQTDQSLKELAAAQAETDRSLKALAAAQARTEQTLAEVVRRQNNSDATLRALGARWGMRSEESFRNAIQGILSEFTDLHVERFLGYDPEGEVFGRPDQVELDLIVRNGQTMLGEIKSSVSKGDVYTFVRKAAFYERRHKIKVDRLVIITPMLDPRAEAATDSLGIRVYTSAYDFGREKQAE
ncbi:MAG: DUF3782 domain-containing protein [Chloroflexi bacterium]|nr:DUF3782 domain-containing protein [Chloroflexota bacterium]